MKNTRMPSEAREKDLQRALNRILNSRSHTGETKVTIAAVAREAGISTALIHNCYPRIAEAIREAQGRSSRAQRDEKHQNLRLARERNRMLRQEIEVLRTNVARLASINEVLLAENRALRAHQGDLKMINLASKKP